MKPTTSITIVCLLAMAIYVENRSVSLAAQNSVGGSAVGVAVNATVTLGGLTAITNVTDGTSVTLPPTGGSDSEQVASLTVGVPGLTILQTGLIQNVTSGNIGPNSAHAESMSTVNATNVLNALVTADVIVAKSTSDSNGTTASSTGAGSTVTNLFVAGVAVPVQPPPNTVIGINDFDIGPLNVNGTVTLNEQIAGGNATTASSLTVNQVHVRVSGSELGGLNAIVADIIIASATSSVEFSAPTAVNLMEFEAVRHGESVLLNWRTANEVDNLGFNIYREEAGGRTRVTPEILAGSALLAGPGTALAAGKSYAWMDRPPGGAEDARYWLQAIDLDGQSFWRGPVVVNRSVAADQLPAYEKQKAVALSALGRIDKAIRQPSTVAVERRAKPVRTDLKRAPSTDLAAPAALKLTIEREGWYRVTQQELVAAGLNSGVDPRLLQLYVDGKELPAIVTGEQDGRFDPADAVEFYGVGPDSPFTNARTYWLATGSRPGKRVVELDGQATPSAPTSFAHTVERKERLIYFSSLRNGDRENFFGPVVAAQVVDQSLLLQHPDLTAGEPAVLEVTLQGVTLTAHHINVIFNGNDLGDVEFAGQSWGVARFLIPHSLLAEGQNQIALAARGGPGDISLVDYVRLTYNHTTRADGDLLRLEARGDQSVTIDGFSSGDVRVIDITSPVAPRALNASAEPGQEGYSVSVRAPGAEPSTLLAFTAGQIRRPASITANRPSGWRMKSNGASYVIITRREFTDSLDPLIDLRRGQRLSVAVVDVEDIYDEFSFGQKTPQAIKDFLYWAAQNWKKKPRYILFAGEASLDPRDYMGLGDFDLVPSKLLDTSLMETMSDDWLADFNDDGLADLAVGRLPARTAHEVGVMVSKITSFDRSPPAQSILMVADSSDGYDFEAANDRLRMLTPSRMKIEEINRGRVDQATARGLLMERINNGQTIVNYLGHGSVDQWRGDLLTSYDAGLLANDKSFPIFLMMTCLNGYGQDPAVDSLAESLLKSERGGAAVLASSGMCAPSPQVYMNQVLYRSFFNAEAERPATLGEAVRSAKAVVADMDVRQTYILFGDPATRLKW